MHNRQAASSDASPADHTANNTAGNTTGRAVENQNPTPDCTLLPLDQTRLIAELRAAVQARDEFVAIAAHELRNPMTPILLQVESLLSACRNPDRCRPDIIAPRLEVLDQAVKEFIRRSTTLLDMTRIANGNIVIEPSRVDLAKVIQAAIERAAIASRMSRCRIDMVFHDGVIGYWDAMALSQVADNLLSNAIKFGSGQTITVTLEAHDGWARFSVRDRGIGISDDDRDRIFQRFERAVTKREHGGFGIGLWLTNQLVEAMGGKIDVDSTQGQGATFMVRLPITSVEASPDERTPDETAG